MKASPPATRCAALVQEFFLERLINQRNASPQTVAVVFHAIPLMVSHGLS
jgi:hypothetical protein